MIGRPRTGPRLALLGALLAVAAVTACTTEPDGQGDVRPSTSATETATRPAETGRPDELPPTDAPAARYRARPCPFDEPVGVTVTCGGLRVPLDRAHPEAGSVMVAVARIRAPGVDPTRPPVVYLEGGPGGASLVWADYWAGHRLARHREIILFDQRGTGWSTPNLACDAEFDDAPATESDPATYRRCRHRLDARTDTEHFTTLAAAHDVVDLLAALKLPPVDLVGTSYGTRLALVTADLAPHAVRSLVLDSVYPPGVEAFDLQGPNGEEAFEALFSLCAATPACEAAYPDLAGTLAGAVAALDADPVAIEWGDDEGDTWTAPATGTDLVDAVFGALYDRTLVAAIPYAIAAAATGTPDDLQHAFDVLAGETDPGDRATRLPPPRRRGTDPPDDSDGLYYSVTCSEEMPLTSADEITEAGADLDDAWREGLLAGVRAEVDVCGMWDVDGSSSVRLRPVESDLPALLLAGALDPITPPHWAHEAAATLSAGTVVVLPAVGHGVMDSHLCAMDLVLAFLEDPAAPVDDDCVASVIAPPFAVP